MQMRDRDWQIALFGTFDVENYGDLLFPLIAEAELTERLGPVKIHPFSYHARTPPHWPYQVTSLTELPQKVSYLDAALIGGGHIIRFDKEVALALGYGPPTPAIHHPTGYWLTPALMALQHGVPLIWNAPGMQYHEIPAWADPLMELVFPLSRYISVRDHLSQTALARFVEKTQIAVMPDTAFGIPKLVDTRRGSDELRVLRKASGLTDPYIIVQATPGLDPFLRFVKTHSDRLRDFRFLALPIGPLLGDNETALGDELPGMVRLPFWPHPLLLAELISDAAAVVGYSYHLAITALAFGVPVFCPVDLSVGKYVALSGFDTIFPLPNETETDPQLFITRLGKTVPSQAARAARDQLERHWDRIATVIREGLTDSRRGLDQFWQSLPGLLESLDASVKVAEAYRADSSRQIEDKNVALAAMEAHCADLSRQIEDQSVAIAATDAHCADLSRQIEDQNVAIAVTEARFAEKHARVDELKNLLALARTEIATREDRILKLHHSPSWRVTAPLRYVMRRLKRLVAK
jgi:lipopolysaccharide transport system ATP-binding protein